MVTSMQLTMSRPEWFQPVRSDAGHYVPALQSLPGELAALAHASRETWEHLTPLIQLRGPKTSRKEPYREEAVAGWAKKVFEAVGRQPCFLDTLRLTSTHPTKTKVGECPVLSVIHAAARKRGLEFVPVLKLGSKSPEVRLIRNAALTDGRGVALRYRLLSLALPAGRTAEALIKETLTAVEVEFAGADLLIDLGFLSQDAEVHAEDVAPAVTELAAAGEWRSVVLMGTSMPSSLGGGVVKEGTIGRLPRREWDLWCDLRDFGLDRIPTYGDYAIQHPDPPLEGHETGPGQRANIRYTTNEVTLVPRAVGAVVTEGREQYRDLCRQLVVQPEYAGREFTWGDELIADCAYGHDEPGWQNHWRGAGTSHHLRHVVEQLARFLTGGEAPR
jgi:hypothetical protein